jgi:MIP family channel proteins
MDKPALTTRLAAEVIGTFGFFFMGFMGVAALIKEPGSIGTGGIAAGFGLGLALMIFAFGHISGGHFNPAVSLGLAVGRKFPWVEVLPYWAAQLAGGLIAAGVIRIVFPTAIGKTLVSDAIVNAPGAGVSDGVAVILEVIATFLFLLVIFTVATDARAPWNGVLAPVAIGMFIFTAATVVGPISGGSFNPARSLAPAIIAGEWGNVWIYIVGPIVGAAIAGAVHLYFRSTEPVTP